MNGFYPCTLFMSQERSLQLTTNTTRTANEYNLLSWHTNGCATIYKSFERIKCETVAVGGREKVNLDIAVFMDKQIKSLEGKST